MARKPKNPINDISKLVGGWLGGRGPGTNPQVQAAMDATRAVGKVVDTATGGFGQALISDAQRMARSGSSTPSALYKTAAVNLGAAAVGAGAAKVAGKVASKVVDARAAKELRSLTPTASESNRNIVLFHGGMDPKSKNAFDAAYRPVHKREGLPNVHMGSESAAADRGQTHIGWDNEADLILQRKSTIDRYEVVNPRAVSKRRRVDNAFIDQEEFADMSEYESSRYVQFYDDIPTPKNKILSYINDLEGRGSRSYLVPKSRIESGDVVYRGTKAFENQFLDVPYTSPRLNRLRDVQSQIVAAQPRVTTAGAAAGVAAPKKKARGGGKNKR